MKVYVLMQEVDFGQILRGTFYKLETAMSCKVPLPKAPPESWHCLAGPQRWIGPIPNGPYHSLWRLPESRSFIYEMELQ